MSELDMGVENGGTRGHVPPIKISGGTSPPKIRMKISNSDYFNGFKLDPPLKFYHNLSIVVAILDRTKPIHVLTSAIKTHVIPLIRPERDRRNASPPARNVWRRPCKEMNRVNRPCFRVSHRNPCLTYRCVCGAVPHLQSP